MDYIKVGACDPSFTSFGMTKGIYYPSTEELRLKDLRLVTTEPSKKFKRKNQDDHYRAVCISKALKEYMAKVDILFVEMPVGSQSARAMCSYGVCIGILSMLDKPIIITDAKEGKIALAGSNTASKKAMITAAKSKFPDLNWFNASTKDEHLADAIASMLVGLGSDEFKLLMRNV